MLSAAPKAGKSTLLRSLLRDLYRGGPLAPEGEGPASIFWMLHVYQALGVPAPLVSALWPLTMTATLAAELVNTAATNGAALAGSSAALLLAPMLPLLVASKANRRHHTAA